MHRRSMAMADQDLSERLIGVEDRLDGLARKVDECLSAIGKAQVKEMDARFERLDRQLAMRFAHLQSVIRARRE